MLFTEHASFVMHVKARMTRWLCLLLFVLLAVGCTSHPRKQIPAGWYVVPAEPSEQLADAGNSADTSPAVSDASVTQTSLTQTNIPQARLQVFICYGWFTSNHACVRIDGPGKHALFWDPGGGYGQHDEAIPTKHDLLLDNDAVSQAQLWDYRSIGCNEPAVLMFEWLLSQQQARDLRDVLVNGQRKDGKGGSFDSDVPGGFCSMAVSSFLRKYTSELTPLPRRWFWPHNLAKHLWKYEPARVLLYQRDEPVIVYVAR